MSQLIAIYDMDRTVTKRPTYNGFLAHMVLARAPWRAIFLPLVPFGLLLYACKIWRRKQLKQFSMRLFVGSRVPQSAFDGELQRHAANVAARNVFPQFCERLAAEKADGYTHVLATASYALYVDAIAAKLGFDHVIATELARDGKGNVLAQIVGENCFDADKLNRVVEWMAAHELVRDNCHIRAYSDHISDAPLLEFADEAFATNPHPPLAKLAKEKGWSVIDWR